MERLRHGEIAAVGERRLHESLLDAEVFEAVEELRVRHLHDAALDRVRLLRVEVEAHHLNNRIRKSPKESYPPSATQIPCSPSHSRSSNRDQCRACAQIP